MTTFDAVAIRRDYVRRLVALKLWHAWRLHKCDDVDLETALVTRVDLYRLSVFGTDAQGGGPEDAEGWQRVLDDLGAVYERHDADAMSSEIEVEGLALLWPSLEPRIERDAAQAAQTVAESSGCFTCEYTAFYAEPESADHLTLHVRNAHQPDSPFQHLPEMIENLQSLIAGAQRERADVMWVQCGTWLNSFPPFARLFPQVWAETAVPGTPGNHFGWWGQFMDRRGGFHEENARRFRETGEFPYMHLLCRCPLTDLREHLLTLTKDMSEDGGLRS